MRPVEVEYVYPEQGSLSSSFTARDLEVVSQLLLSNQVSKTLNPCEYILHSRRPHFPRITSNCHGYKASESGLHAHGRVHGDLNFWEDRGSSEDLVAESCSVQVLSWGSWQ